MGHAGVTFPKGPLDSFTTQLRTFESDSETIPVPVCRIYVTLHRFDVLDWIFEQNRNT